jgi:hypothetical protein
MTLTETETPPIIVGMRRVVQILLIPFWLLGFLVAMVALLIMVMWDAGKAGWSDGFDRHGGNR